MHGRVRDAASPAAMRPYRLRDRWRQWFLADNSVPYGMSFYG